MTVLYCAINVAIRVKKRFLNKVFNDVNFADAKQYNPLSPTVSAAIDLVDEIIRTANFSAILTWFYGELTDFAGIKSSDAFRL